MTTEKNKKNLRGNLQIVGASSGPAVFSDQIISSAHDFYLSGEIGPSTDYVDWFHIIRNAGENDFLRLHFNSVGGDVFTAIQLMKCIKDTQAHVHGIVEGSCMSAATFIFLSCDSFEISPHSIFMVHNYSGGAIGKGGEMKAQLDHETVWSRKLCEDVYENFLSKEEIDNILKSQDIWLNGEEVADRLRKRSEKK